MNSVSVIVTSYNYGRYLAAAVRSALDQPLPAGVGLEVIVVDDGSTDDSVEVAAAFGDRVALVRQSNRGHATAASAGFRVSHGEMVVFLDADDELVPGALARFLAGFVPAAGAADDIVHVQGFLDCVDADGAPTGDRIPGRVDDTDRLRERVLAAGPGSYVCSPTSGNAWSRDFLRQVMPLPAAHRGGMEPLLTDTAPLFGSTRSLAAPSVARYRRHDTGMSTGRREMTTRNLSRTLAEYELRARFLAEVAARQQVGVAAPAYGWLAGNWRLAALRSLLWAQGGGARPSFSGGVARPLRLARRPALQLKVAALLFAFWAGPPGVVRRLGGHIIRLDYM